MLIKVGEKIISSKESPIMVVLNEEEKELISNMRKEDDKFCAFPNDAVEKDIKEFMEVSDNMIDINNSIDHETISDYKYPNSAEQIMKRQNNMGFIFDTRLRQYRDYVEQLILHMVYSLAENIEAIGKVEKICAYIITNEKPKRKIEKEIKIQNLSMEQMRVIFDAKDREHRKLYERYTERYKKRSIQTISFITLLMCICFVILWKLLR